MVLGLLVFVAMLPPADRPFASRWSRRLESASVVWNFCLRGLGRGRQTANILDNHWQDHLHTAMPCR